MNEFYAYEEDAVMTHTKMTDDEAYILLAALRYQLPRRTYGSFIVSSYIEKNIHRISKVDIDLLIMNIEDAFNSNKISTIDADEWKRLLKILKSQG